jgi:hypothetical protein
MGDNFSNVAAVNAFLKRSTTKLNSESSKIKSLEERQLAFNAFNALVDKGLTRQQSITYIEENNGPSRYPT